MQAKLASLQNLHLGFYTRPFSAEVKVTDL